MNFESVKELEEFFNKEGIFPINAFKVQGEMPEYIISGENKFKKMVEFIKQKEIKTVIYQDLVINEEEYHISNDEIEYLIGEKTTEFLKEYGYLENLYSVIEQHNKEVKNHLGLLDSYKLEVINEGVVYSVTISNFGINYPEVMLENFLSNYESELEEYGQKQREQGYEKRKNLFKEKERKKQEAIESLIQGHIDEVRSLPNKPARTEHMARIAEAKGLDVYRKDITMALDLVLSKK
ncbi:hypothetical protein EXW58_29235 (plasmid) [Bacillus mycoides]|uniref:hypothetical protein n=1 Tax=Bacillus mycoides TaxID=1405 RepID=UPI001C02441B|nr:hypothetical protein [Bacillus mycoides]QWG31465.1 hypothetical protein EXW58_29235 [Bacillus mycoides]